jgi:hypothetical protein
MATITRKKKQSNKQVTEVIFAALMLSVLLFLGFTANLLRLIGDQNTVNDTAECNMFLPCRINVVRPMIRTLRTRRWQKVNDKETAQVEVSEQQQQEAKERLRSFQEEAERGQAEAQYNLGLVYRDGDGIHQDSDRARHFLELAAEQGHTEAQVAFATSECTI